MSCKRGNCQTGYACNRKTKTCVSKKMKGTQTKKKIIKTMSRSPPQQLQRKATDIRKYIETQVEEQVFNKFNIPIKLTRFEFNDHGDEFYNNVEFTLIKHKIKIGVDKLFVYDIKKYNIKYYIEPEILNEDDYNDPIIWIEELSLTKSQDSAYKLSEPQINIAKSALNLETKQITKIYKLTQFVLKQCKQMCKQYDVDGYY